MINENDIRKELKMFVENTIDVKNYIEKRLKQYSDDNNNDFTDLKTYFASNVDVVQPNSQQEEEEAYLKIVNDFLSQEGY
jgi:hypothetical protein